MLDDRTKNALLVYACAVPSMLFSGLTWVVIVTGQHDRLTWALLDTAGGLIGLALLHWRHRGPRSVTAITTLLTAVSEVAVGPAQVAYVLLSMERRRRQIAGFATLYWLCLLIRASLYGIQQATFVTIGIHTLILGALTVLALYLRGRRDVRAFQRDAALAAEREQTQRVEQAKLAERVKIAQEMHDVLAHRISLLSMLAGGLAYRTNLTPEETRSTALAIQENAHQSMNDLRSVLNTLRTPQQNGALEAPQPNLAHLDALFDEVRAAGQKVDVHDTINDRERLPAQTGRHAYRIIQEALTNARKHAPGSRVTAELTGGPGDGLRVRVSNPASGTTTGPGGRLGLIGLAERTRTAGGTIAHTIQDGRFVLEARLPWEA
ncbi:sensor histidine kinase [Nonomuraea rhizosphaerae]|uniref:sensor histidine kinase n=1 Tax=Nonomuraea rhizosphaerae TaxID=2665663 RepID=UPI001C5D291D|nr:histidine kinase [Nonomuraea rhizosphaerae]